MKFRNVLASNFVLLCIIVTSLYPANAITLSATLNPAGISTTGIVPAYYPPVQPTSGQQKTIAILVEFTDVKHTVNQASIDSMIFQAMAKYYDEVSYGQLQVVGKSVGWFTLAHTMAYYGQDISKSPGSDARKVQLVKDAVELAQNDADFRDYSRVIIVHAGAGQEDSKQSDLIWSQAYWYDLNIRTNNGATVKAAAVVPEMEAEGHSTLGVYVHEYGHLLSLPDLYNENLEASVPDNFVGRWSPMGTGLWLGNPKGSSPAELEAWSRIKLGWLTPDTIDLQTDNVTFRLVMLQPLEKNSGTRAIEIPTQSHSYYLIEFRTNVDFDKYLPGEGLLVTRIDERRDVGGGIVQVVDADPSTQTLNDATYGVGATFKDPENNLFFQILPNSGNTFPVVVGNRDPSSLALKTTQIIAPQMINASYSQPASFSVRLSDNLGIGLAGRRVGLQYYGYGRWNDLAATITDSRGNANFQKLITLDPGQYYVRFLFTGSNDGDSFLTGNDYLTILNLRKLETKLQFQGPLVFTATGQSLLTLKATDEFGKPIQNLQVQTWLDGKLVQENTVTQGTVRLALNLGFYQIGRHDLRIELKDTTYYSGTSLSQQITVLPPAWIYAVVIVGVVFLAVSILVYVAVGRQRIRKRRRD